MPNQTLVDVIFTVLDDFYTSWPVARTAMQLEIIS